MSEAQITRASARRIAAVLALVLIAVLAAAPWWGSAANLAGIAPAACLGL